MIQLKAWIQDGVNSQQNVNCETTDSENRRVDHSRALSRLRSDRWMERNCPEWLYSGDKVANGVG